MNAKLLKSRLAMLLLTVLLGSLAACGQAATPTVLPPAAVPPTATILVVPTPVLAVADITSAVDTFLSTMPDTSMRSATSTRSRT